ncbi:MAG: hypothetical protein JWO30_448 [Fibrobacteres bacterium]|nr:hypothetical protein [Fibrobacterota bacterium]
MIFKGCRLLIACALCLTAAHAQVEKRFSLTMSPIHLALPALELTGEYALAPKFGVSAIAGFGSISIKETDNSTLETKSINIPFLELGGQMNYYLVGSFRHGMQLGGELLWIKLSLPKGEDVSGTANGVAVGPLIGYKWAARFGLTLMAQLGYEFLFAQAKTTDANGNEVESSTDSGIPLLNLNIGWSL